MAQPPALSCASSTCGSSSFTSSIFCRCSLGSAKPRQPGTSRRRMYPRCRGVPRHRASALLPGAAPRNDFFIHSLFTQLGNPFFWETPGSYLFNVHHFTKALNETGGKNCDWPNFVKNKVPLVVRYTLTVHICTSSTQLDYLDLMILGFFSKLNDSNSNLPRDMAESPPPEVFKMQLDKVLGSLI